MSRHPHGAKAAIRPAGACQMHSFPGQSMSALQLLGFVRPGACCCRHHGSVCWRRDCFRGKTGALLLPHVGVLTLSPRALGSHREGQTGKDRKVTLRTGLSERDSKIILLETG